MVGKLGNSNPGKPQGLLESLTHADGRKEDNRLGSAGSPTCRTHYFYSRDDQCVCD